MSLQDLTSDFGKESLFSGDGPEPLHAEQSRKATKIYGADRIADVLENYKTLSSETELTTPMEHPRINVQLSVSLNCNFVYLLSVGINKPQVIKGHYSPNPMVVDEPHKAITFHMCDPYGDSMKGTLVYEGKNVEEERRKEMAETLLNSGPFKKFVIFGRCVNPSGATPLHKNIPENRIINVCYLREEDDRGGNEESPQEPLQQKPLQLGV